MKLFINLNSFQRRLKMKKGFSIINIRSDHDGEFISDLFESFCEEKGYHHNFSTPRTPQQNVFG
jgi:transposase InsO family protein